MTCKHVGYLFCDTTKINPVLGSSLVKNCLAMMGASDPNRRNSYHSTTVPNDDWRLKVRLRPSNCSEAIAAPPPNRAHVIANLLVHHWQFPANAYLVFRAVWPAQHLRSSK